MKIFILCVVLDVSRNDMCVGIKDFLIPLVVASENGTAYTSFYNWCFKVIASGALNN